MSKNRHTIWDIVVAWLLTVGLSWLARRVAHGMRRLAFRWRRALAPVWCGAALWAGAAIWHRAAPAWWWLALALPGATTALALAGPRLTGPVRRLSMALVPSGIDSGKPGVLDRVPERAYLAGLGATVGAYLALRSGAGASATSALVWQGGLALFGGTWWFHRRIRVTGRADRFARKWSRLTDPERCPLNLRDFVGSKVVQAVGVRGTARLCVKLADARTVDQVSKHVKSLASFFHLRPGAVFMSEDPDAAHRVWITFMPRDPWKGRLPHPLLGSEPRSIKSLRKEVPVGLYADGTEIRLALRHMLIVGATGSGKSAFLESLLYTLALCQDVVLVGADMASGATLGVWRRLFAVPLATDRDSTTALMERLLATIEDRERQLGLDKDDSDDALDAFEPSSRTPWVVFFFDEFPDWVAEASKSELALFGRIGKRARKCGLWLILAAQNGSKMDTGSKELQAQLRTVVGLALENHASRVLWGDLARTGWSSTGLKTGQFLARDDEHATPQVAKGWFVDTKAKRDLVTRLAGARPYLEPSAWACLTGISAGSPVVIDMEPVEPQEEILRTLWLADGGLKAQHLASVCDVSRATVFRKLRSYAADGQAYSLDGLWFYGRPPTGDLVKSEQAERVG